jgi:signal transduction histidine kinase
VFRSVSAIAAEDPRPAEPRLLETLQELMKLPALELRPALVQAATLVASALSCEKVDAFLLDESHQTLRAVGTSETPMGRHQHELGLDALPLANGGRIVQVFRSGTSYVEGHADRDPDEVRGLVEALGIRSTLTVPLEVNGERRGVLAAASSTPEFFHAQDIRFLEIVSRWVGMLAHRAELAENVRNVESEDARRRGADEVITVLAHDVRNHLQPLSARLQLMSLNVANGRNVAASELEKALQTVERLSRLTSDILDLKRLDEGLFNLNLAPVDLVAVAKETAASLETSTVSVVVTGEPSLVAIADANRVRQALENLVANASKYSPVGKAVEVRVLSEEFGGRSCGTLEVLDEGPGIAPEMSTSLFDRFSSSADSEGLGLGLHISRRIARIHHGELTAHRRARGGTCFRLTLPLDPT